VPVIRQLAERLELYRLRCGGDGWIFSTSNHTPLSLHNVVNRVILPTLDRCRHCGQTEDGHLPHLLGEKKPCSGYERDGRIPEWLGFHAARRGLGSNLNRLGVDDSVIQRILRHSNLSTTRTYYIKTSTLDAQRAMQKFEQNLSLQASLRPIGPGSEEKSGFVN
jgi:integrase